MLNTAINALILAALIMGLVRFWNTPRDMAIIRDNSMYTMITLARETHGAHECAFSMLKQSEQTFHDFYVMENDFITKHRKKKWFRSFYWGGQKVHE